MARLYFGTKKTNIIFLCVVCFIAFLIGGLFVLTSWTGSPQGMINTANQFKTDPSWTLVNESIVPPKTFFCIAGEQVCSGVGRSWKIPSSIDRNDLQTLLNKSHWNDVKITNCYPNAEDDKTVDCTAEGGVGEYSIRINTVTHPSNSQTPELYLFVSERL